MSVSKINFNENKEAYIVVDPIGDINKRDFKKYLDMTSPSFLECEFEKDKAFILYYKYGERITLKQFLSHVVDKEEALAFLKSMTKVYMDAESAGLNLNHILLGINSVFYDENNKQVSCVYVPVNEGILPARPLRLFIKEILVNMLYNEEDDMTWLGNVIRYISRNRQLECADFYAFLQKQEEENNKQDSEIVSDRMVANEEEVSEEKDDTEDLKLFLESIPAAESVNALKVETKVEETPAEDVALKAARELEMVSESKKNIESETDIDEAVRAIAEKVNAEVLDKNHEKTDAENDEESTVEMPEESAIETVQEPVEEVDPRTYILLRRADHTSVILKKTDMRIGKAADNDICINDNPAISRVHAILSYVKGGYVIRDNGSTNHTFVNGIVLVGNQEKALSAGDRILLGNEEFVFKIQ